MAERLVGVRGRLCMTAAAMALIAGIGATSAEAASLETSPYEPAEDRLWAAKSKKKPLQAGSFFTVPNPYNGGGAITDIKIGTLRLFGDSYSDINRTTRFPNWAQQLKAEGDVQNIANFAKSGATAAVVGSNHFKKQFNQFNKSKPVFAANDLTVVYLGYNDIDRADLTKSKADYTTYVNKIIGKGATGDQRRLLLVMPHDWGRNPQQNGDPGGVFKARTLDWRQHVAGVANGRQQVVAVDMYTAFEKIFANPKKYGLKNIVKAQKKRAATDFLFEDGNHFGRRGQELIKQVFEHYLTRGWDWANTLQAGDSAATRLNQDIDAGLVFNASAFTAEERLGLTAFPVGSSSLAELETADSDVTRAAFAQAHAPDLQDGGVGFNYELASGLKMGFVISQYDEDVRSSREMSTATGSVESDSIAVYMQHELGPLELGTRLIYSDETHQHRLYDDLIGQTDKATFDGRTVELSQRAGYPIHTEGFTLTPWLQLTQRMQELDGFTMSNPYVSDTTYKASAVSDTEAGIGIDLVSRPLALGEETSLLLFGGVSYTHSLVRDDYEVKIQERAVQGYTQHETVERPELRTVGLNLGAQMQVGERLALGAGLGLTHDPAEGSAQAGRIELTYRF